MGARCCSPLSLPVALWDPGECSATVPILPFPRKRPSFISTETTIYLFNYLQDPQGAGTCWGSSPFWGGNEVVGMCVLKGGTSLGWPLAPGSIRAVSHLVGSMLRWVERRSLIRDSPSIAQCDSCAWGWTGQGTPRSALPAAPLALPGLRRASGQGSGCGPR